MRCFILLLAVVVLSLCLTVASCKAQTPIEFNIEWTATGDDSSSGTASFYDIRYSTDSLTLESDWDNAIQLHGEPVPLPSGQLQSHAFEIPVESETTYFFALKVGDEIPNWSAVSNILSKTTPDVVPPNTVMLIRVTIQ